MNELIERFSSRQIDDRYGIRLVVVCGDVMNALQPHESAERILVALFKSLPLDAALIKTNGQAFAALKAKDGEGYRDAVGMLVASGEWEAIKPVPEMEIKLEDLIDVNVSLNQYGNS